MDDHAAANKGDFLSFFSVYVSMSFLSFSCLIALAKISSAISDRGGENGCSSRFLFQVESIESLAQGWR